ncbi:hypothetical protein UBV09_14000 [Streptomyces griseoincarnatus]|nr:hypothetical protein [Streptomyces sp. HNS054]WPW23691.1 hypothetical protein UBV09_14000 [Streptomyces griseoincarnatus]
MIRAAEAAGNLEATEEWEERLQRLRAARHHRRMDLLHSPVDAAKGVAVGAGMSVGVLVALGVVLAISTGQAGHVVTPLAATIDFIALLIRIVHRPAHHPRRRHLRRLDRRPGTQRERPHGRHDRQHRRAVIKRNHISG